MVLELKTLWKAAWHFGFTTAADSTSIQPLLEAGRKVCDFHSQPDAVATGESGDWPMLALCVSGSLNIDSGALPTLSL